MKKVPPKPPTLAHVIDRRGNSYRIDTKYIHNICLALAYWELVKKYMYVTKTYKIHNKYLVFPTIQELKRYNTNFKRVNKEKQKLSMFYYNNFWVKAFVDMEKGKEVLRSYISLTINFKNDFWQVIDKNYKKTLNEMHAEVAVVENYIIPTLKLIHSASTTILTTIPGVGLIVGSGISGLGKAIENGWDNTDIAAGAMQATFTLLLGKLKIKCTKFGEEVGLKVTQTFFLNRFNDLMALSADLLVDAVVASRFKNQKFLTDNLVKHGLTSKLAGKISNNALDQIAALPLKSNLNRSILSNILKIAIATVTETVARDEVKKLIAKQEQKQKQKTKENPHLLFNELNSFLHKAVRKNKMNVSKKLNNKMDFYYFNQTCSN